MAYVSSFEMSVPLSEIRIEEIQLKTVLRLARMNIEVLLKFDHQFHHATLQIQKKIGGKTDW